MRMYLRVAHMFVAMGCMIGDFEMVYNVTEFDGGEIQRQFELIFQEAGYETVSAKCIAYQFGLPQTRWRIHTTVVNTRYGSAAELQSVEFIRQPGDPTCLADILQPAHEVPSNLFVDSRRERLVESRAAAGGRPLIIGYLGK